MRCLSATTLMGKSSSHFGGAKNCWQTEECSSNLMTPLIRSSRGVFADKEKNALLAAI